MTFGEHLTIDGYGGDKDMLNNKARVFDCIDKLPELLGMHKLSKSEIYWAEGNDTKDPGGWSGFVVIEESHIAVHTFPGRRFVSADVYTCQNGLNSAFIIDYFKKQFGLADVETNFIKRGTRYPDLDIV